MVDFSFDKSCSLTSLHQVNLGLMPSRTPWLLFHSVCSAVKIHSVYSKCTKQEVRISGNICERSVNLVIDICLGTLKNIYKCFLGMVERTFFRGYLYCRGNKYF